MLETERGETNGFGGGAAMRARGEIKVFVMIQRILRELREAAGGVHSYNLLLEVGFVPRLRPNVV